MKRIQTQSISSQQSDSIKSNTNIPQINNTSSMPSVNSYSHTVFQILFQNHHLKSLPQIIHNQLYIKINLEGLPQGSWKILRLQNFIIVLTNSWLKLPIDVNERICVYPPAQQKVILIPKQKYLIITHAEQLVSPTSINNYISCNRRIILKELLEGNKQSNQKMVWGSIVHKIFELKSQQFITSNDSNNCLNIIDQISSDQDEILLNRDTKCRKKNKLESQIYQMFLTQLWLINCQQQQFYNIFQSKNALIQKWFIKYIYKKDLIRSNGLIIKIEQIVNSQLWVQNQWFSLGIKGQIDMVLRCSVQYQKKQYQNIIVPFQIKSGGKLYSFQITQTVFYMFLLKVKHKQDFIFSLLYHLNSNQFHACHFDYNHVLGIYLGRAIYLKSKKNLFKHQQTIVLPAMSQNSRDCKSCEYMMPCSGIALTNYQNKIEKKHQQNLQILQQNHLPTFMKDLQNYRSIKHNLNLQQRFYLQKWFTIIQLIQKQQSKKLDNCCWSGFEVLHKQNKQIRILKKNKNCNQIKQLLNELKKDDKIYLYNPQSSQLIRGIISQDIISKHNAKSIDIKVSLTTHFSNQYSSKWKLYKFHKNFYPIMRYNVITLLTTNTHHNTLIYDRQIKPPKIINLISIQNILQEITRNYNQGQKDVINKVLAMKQFNLILGMPGTGKTFLIVDMIYIFFTMKQTVLVSCLTNNALDQILRRYLQKYPQCQKNCIRIGTYASPHQKIQQVLLKNKKFKQLKELDEYFKSKRIYFVTMHSINNEYIANKKFDICFIDQASHCLEPLSLGPILKSQKFVLIGDHYQLEPLVNNQMANKKGANISLFQRLFNKFPQNCSYLTKQFRMCKQIMSLSNKLIYQGKLEIGNEQICNKKLEINFSLNSNDQIGHIINPQNNVVFVNIDQTQKYCNKVIQNQNKKNIDKTKHRLITKIQIQLIKKLFYLFIQYGLNQSQIAIIAIYNDHVKKIQRQIRSKINPVAPQIYTIDKSQGIDKECVIILLQDKFDSYEQIIDNWRRVNVAFTRAKRKLIVIGSQKNLTKKQKKIKEFIQQMKNKNWMININQKTINNVL